MDGDDDMASTSTDYEKYEAVQRFPILKAYLEHFERTSMDNAIPGLLSFFFVQGQIAVQYVRLPTGDGTSTLVFTYFGFNHQGQANLSHGTSLVMY